MEQQSASKHNNSLKKTKYNISLEKMFLAAKANKNRLLSQIIYKQKKAGPKIQKFNNTPTSITKQMTRLLKQ